MIAGEQGVLPVDGAAAPGAAADRRPLHRRQRGHVRAHQGLGQGEESFRPPGSGSPDRFCFVFYTTFDLSRSLILYIHDFNQVPRPEIYFPSSIRKIASSFPKLFSKNQNEQNT